MLRVKVFRLKETLIKFFLGISILIIVYCMLICLLRIVKKESRTFAANIVEVNLDYSFLAAGFNVQILKDELGISLGKKENNDIECTPIILTKEDNSTEYIENDLKEKYISSSVGIKTWDRPKSYLVNQLASGKVQVGNSFITNYTNKELNIDELAKVSDFIFDDNLKILIVHTHTSEAYSEIGNGENFRTLDDSMNVVSVGDVLEKNLLLKNFNVKHSCVKHDTPSYNGSYAACLKTVEEELKESDYDIVLDIHRDALASNLNFRPTTEINGESVAKLMFVVGTNASGLSHDKWMENLKLALLIQNTANEMYPGLFRDLNLSKSRYNQHVCNGALILEVGATGNTLDEVWNSMKYFSNILEALKDK